jgi:hypothetical protein
MRECFAMRPERGINEGASRRPYQPINTTGTHCAEEVVANFMPRAFEPTNMCAVALSAGSSINQPYGTQIFPS